MEILTKEIITKRDVVGKAVTICMYRVTYQLNNLLFLNYIGRNFNI